MPSQPPPVTTLSRHPSKSRRSHSHRGHLAPLVTTPAPDGLSSCSAATVHRPHHQLPARPISQRGGYVRDALTTVTRGALPRLSHGVHVRHPLLSQVTSHDASPVSPSHCRTNSRHALHTLHNMKPGRRERCPLLAVRPEYRPPPRPDVHRGRMAPGSAPATATPRRRTGRDTSLDLTRGKTSDPRHRVQLATFLRVAMSLKRQHRTATCHRQPASDSPRIFGCACGATPRVGMHAKRRRGNWICGWITPSYGPRGGPPHTEQATERRSRCGWKVVSVPTHSQRYPCI